MSRKMVRESERETSHPDLRRVGRLRPIEESAPLVVTLIRLCYLLHGRAREAGNLDNQLIPLFHGAGASFHSVRYLFV